jgi:hypothetical protein
MIGEKKVTSCAFLEEEKVVSGLLSCGSSVKVVLTWQGKSWFPIPKMLKDS